MTHSPLLLASKYHDGDGRQFWRHLVPRATHTMRRWNRAYVSHFCAALPDRPVFATLTGRRLSSSRIYQITDG